jgi:hypothetical protein
METLPQNPLSSIRCSITFLVLIFASTHAYHRRLGAAAATTNAAAGAAAACPASISSFPSTPTSFCFAVINLCVSVKAH